MPKLSIITINFNNKDGLARTVKSVIGQTFTDFEYIIIDGGSTDGSSDIISQVSDRLAFWISEPDKGIYNAMNKGISNTKGEYLLFLNSGDCLFNNEVLTKAFEFIEDPYEIVSGNLCQLFPNGKKILERMPEYITAKFLFNSYIAHPSTFIKRTLFLKHGLFDESYQIAGDHAFFVKVFLMDSINYLHINTTISFYTMDGISSDPKSFVTIKKERSRAFKEQLPPEYFNLVQKNCKRNVIAKILVRVYNKLNSLFQGPNTFRH